ncbi:hypothetical protein AB6A40_005744 [Gnathostoma spinigerum]|uniref:SH3 domain-containing protein n=1 Tax=Gnathostoma spinigerum TaxID=75299 RepID=A0ABD6ERZ9_9BILA
MSEMEANRDPRGLILTEVPEGRAVLEESYANLERVAAYCEANYAQTTDKRKAFEETKAYTVQSLASVAYQVNTLACALIQILEFQAEKIANMVPQIQNVEQIVDIHKEKVARREIGVLTTNRFVHRDPKIITPTEQERVPRYQRMPIDYTVLDGLGHGVKQVEPVSRTLIARTASNVSGGSSTHHYPIFPNLENLLPKIGNNATLSRSSISRSDHYRVPQVTPTPVIDPQKFSSVTQNSPYAAGAGMISQNLMESGGSERPSGSNSRYGSIASPRDSYSVPMPPPQLASVSQYRLSDNSLDGLPPPPTGLMGNCAEEPLPPPPVTVMSQQYEKNSLNGNYHRSSSLNTGSLGAPRPVLGMNFEDRADWIPKNYLEKAVVLYDYDAEKPDELTLRENNVVYVLRKNEDGWFEGVLNGCTGLFPGNYVQKI